MERKYNIIIGLLAILGLVSLAGFLKTYFGFFPSFEGVPTPKGFSIIISKPT